MKRLLTMIAVATLMTGTLFAQSAPAPSPNNPVKPATINERQENQQQRIANGVASGQLTARETRNLEARETRVNQEVRADRAANGGKLTPAERRHVNRQQNRTSRAIYRDKHNNTVQPR